jgi:hypothetical protein
MKYLKKYRLYLEEVDVKSTDSPNLQLSKDRLNTEQEEIGEFNKLKPKIEKIYKDEKDPEIIKQKVDELLGDKENSYVSYYRAILNREEEFSTIQDKILKLTQDVNNDKQLLSSSTPNSDNKSTIMSVKSQIADREMEKSKNISKLSKLKVDIDKEEKELKQKMQDNVKGIENDLKDVSKSQK